MPYEPKPGDAACWKGEGGAKPILKIKVTAHRNIREGEEVELALWTNDYKDREGQPDFKGKMQDKWVNPKHQGNQRKLEKEVGEVFGGDDFNDEIPF